MSVRVAKCAGFCFGVSRAVELVEQAAQAGKQVATLGPIIHNRHVVEKFQSMGVRVIETPEEATPAERRRQMQERTAKAKEKLDAAPMKDDRKNNDKK